MPYFTAYTHNRCRCTSMTCVCCAVLCLCKCMKERALRSVRACFRVGLLALRFNASTLYPASLLFTPLLLASTSHLYARFSFFSFTFPLHACPLLLCFPCSLRTPNKPKNTIMEPQPTISHQAFWNLPEVKAIQETQKQNHPRTDAWQAAEYELLQIARKYKAEQFFE